MAAVMPRRCYVGVPRTTHRRDYYFSVLDDMVVSGVWGMGNLSGWA